jgi:hypothetical protein
VSLNKFLFLSNFPRRGTFFKNHKMREHFCGMPDGNYTEQQMNNSGQLMVLLLMSMLDLTSSIINQNQVWMLFINIQAVLVSMT